MARSTANGSLSPSTIRQFTTVQDSTLSHRALGWETPNGTNSAGHLMSKRAFGHTGFTGTSIWMDLDRGVFVLLLTNRVNPTRERRAIGAIRIASRTQPWVLVRGRGTEGWDLESCSQSG